MDYRSGIAALLLAAQAASATPWRPASDDEVLERLPLRAGDPALREIDALRVELRRRPRDVEAAVRLARRYYDQVAAEGDPRYAGYAQAALAPWWNDADPPAAVRVMRAILLQFNHRFAEAVADLDAALRADAGHGEAWSWRAAIAMVQADYPAAGHACEGLGRVAPRLIAVACTAYVDSLTGRARRAAEALRAALRESAEATPAQQLWALTRLGEIEERLGDSAAAEATYRRALALGIADNYLSAAYADLLLDRGRGAEVIERLAGQSRSDVLLLRLALAAKATGSPRLADWQAQLTARFDAARRRGDTTHQKEEARFALVVEGDVRKALALARDNYAVQREPADARVLLEAALAAREPAAAAPVLAWMDASGVESAALQALARRLKGGG